MNFRFLAKNNHEDPNGGAQKTDLKPKLEKIELEKNIIDEEKIDGFLTAMCNVDEARKLVGLNDIAFYSSKAGSYDTVNIPKLITDESIRQVRVTLHDGSYKYFKMIDHLPGGNFASGLKATAFIEITKDGEFVEKDGGKEIRLNFAGYTEYKDVPQLVNTLRGTGNLTTLTSKVLRTLLDLVVNPEKAKARSLETVEFVHDIIVRWGGEGKISHVIYGSHSMGAGNALVAQAVSDIEGIPTKTTLAIEQVMAREQAERIKSALADKESDLYKKIIAVLKPKYGLRDLEDRIAAEPSKLQDEIDNNAISIHAFTFKRNGDHKSSISTVVNKKEHFGREVLQDVGEALQNTRQNKYSDEPRPPKPLIDLWPDHKLKALLSTAKDGNYYNLNASRARDLPELIVGDLAIAQDTDPHTAFFSR